MSEVTTIHQVYELVEQAQVEFELYLSDCDTYFVVNTSSTTYVSKSHSFDITLELALEYLASLT